MPYTSLSLKIIFLLVSVFFLTENKGLTKVVTPPLQCSPSQLHQNKILTLTIHNQSVLKQLAITNPKGKWFYLEVAPTVQIDPQKTKATTWINGVKKKELIFTQPGKYIVYLSDNLETELENSLTFQCVIEFLN